MLNAPERTAGSRTRLRRVLVTVAVAAALAFGATLPGCAGCKGAAPLNFVPQDALVAVVIPSLAAGMKEAKLLLGDRYDAFVAAGGNAQLFFKIIRQAVGATLPESEASTNS